MSSLNTFLCYLLYLCLLTMIIGCQYPLRAWLYQFPSPQDKHHFHYQEIPPEGDNCQEAFVQSLHKFHLPSFQTWAIGDLQTSDLNNQAFFTNSNTHAFLILRNDSILFEQYFNGYQNTTPTIVFSLGKVFITTLIDIAIQQNLLQSTDQKVAEFLPSFQTDSLKSQIRLQDLLNMASGLEQDDYRKPVMAVKLYYSLYLDQMIQQTASTLPPAKEFIYKSIDTQILGRCLEEIMQQSMTQIVEEQLAQPLGFCDPLFFTFDKKQGAERMFGGMAVSARDLMKFAYLYINEGKNLQGQSIISPHWISEIASRELADTPWWGYKNGWWRDGYICNNYLADKSFQAAGYNGQTLFIDPANKTVILRIGENKGGINWHTSLGKLAQQINGAPNKHSFAQQEIAGSYLSSDSTSRFQIKKTNNGWKMESEEGLLKKQTFTLDPYCDHSLYVTSKLFRFIFPEVGETQRISYLIFDDGRGQVTRFARK